MSEGLRVLAVDDETPALDELAFLLGRDHRVGEVLTCGSATDALRMLRSEDFDVVLLDVAMPGLNGLQLARGAPAVPASTRGRVRDRPPAPRRRGVQAARGRLPPQTRPRGTDARGDPTRWRGRRVPRPRRAGAGRALGGVTRFIRRSDVRYVSAQGDYVRLHTATDDPRKPGCHSAHLSSGGRRPDSSASIAVSWSPWRTSTRSDWDPAGQRWSSTASASRSAAATCPTCVACSASPGRTSRDPGAGPAGPDHQSPHRRRAVARAALQRLGDRRPDSGRRGLRPEPDARPAPARGVRRGRARRDARKPAGAVPGGAGREHPRPRDTADLAGPGARRGGGPLARRARRGGTSGAPSATRRRSRISSNDPTGHERARPAARGRRGRRDDAGDRRVRAAGVAHHQ